MASAGAFDPTDAGDAPVLRIRVQRRTPGAFDWRDAASTVTRVTAFASRDQRRAMALLTVEAIGDPPSWHRLTQRVEQLAAMDSTWLPTATAPALAAAA